MSKWISVKDRLPNEGDVVLVTNNQLDFRGYADVYTAVYKYNNWYDWVGNDIERMMICGPVTHWRKAIELPGADETVGG